MRGIVDYFLRKSKEAKEKREAEGMRRIRNMLRGTATNPDDHKNDTEGAVWRDMRKPINLRV